MHYLNWLWQNTTFYSTQLIFIFKLIVILVVCALLRLGTYSFALSFKLMCILD